MQSHKHGHEVKYFGGGGGGDIYILVLVVIYLVISASTQRYYRSHCDTKCTQSSKSSKGQIRRINKEPFSVGKVSTHTPYAFIYTLPVRPIAHTARDLHLLTESSG